MAYRTGPSATVVNNALAKMGAYIERMTKTVIVDVGGQQRTCGLLMSSPGLPVWAKITKYHRSATTAKAKGLWNGSGNDSPPTDWEKNSFNDSGWGSAAESAAFTNIIPNTTSIAYRNYTSGSPAADEEENLIRSHFTLGAIHPLSASVHIHIEDRLLSAYVNGHYLGAATADAPGWQYNDVTFTIDPAWLKMNGDDNVLALRIANSDGYCIAVSFELSVVFASAVGQYCDHRIFKDPHSIIPEQPYQPSWMPDGEIGQDYDKFSIALDDGVNFDMLTAPILARRDFSSTDSKTTYTVQHASDGDNQTVQFSIDTGYKVDVYVGGTEMKADLQDVSSPYTWNNSGVAARIKENNGCFTSLQYPPRHGFHLGKHYYSAMGNTTMAGYFQNSIDTFTDFERDIYDVLYGSLDAQWDDMWFFTKDAYPDLDVRDRGDDMGDRATYAPVGIATDGQYVYPHQSKILMGPIIFFPKLTAGISYGQMLYGLHAAKKPLTGPHTVRLDPRWMHWGIHPDWTWDQVKYTTLVQIAIDALKLWGQNQINGAENFDPEAQERYDTTKRDAAVNKLEVTATLPNNSNVLTLASQNNRRMLGAYVLGPGLTWPCWVTEVDDASVSNVKLSQTNESGNDYTDATYTIWQSIGFPSASNQFVEGPFEQLVQLFAPVYGKGTSFTTAIFLVFMTVMGYGYGHPTFKPYADEAAVVLTNAIAGYDPWFNNGAGLQTDQFEAATGTTPPYVTLTRPDHTGGVISAFKQGSTLMKLQATEKTDLEKFVDAMATYDLRFPEESPWGARQPLISYPYMRQKLEDPNLPPTSMEGTVLAWLALRIYNGYAHNTPYPEGSGARGLSLGISGEPGLGWIDIVDSNSDPIKDAMVIVVDGTSTANPENLTGYLAVDTSDENGHAVVPYRGAGTKTVYVVKSGYRHAKMTYTFAEDDQIVRFPEVTLVAV